MSGALLVVGSSSLSASDYLSCSYLLSPQTSPINGVGAPSARVVLVGSENPSVGRNFLANFEAIRLTEVVEFSLSLSPPSSSKDAYNGLPHLQAYKLIRAFQLAELGHVKEATRYVVIRYRKFFYHSHDEFF
jgi:COPII coat assembly protein SEC16